MRPFHRRHSCGLQPHRRQPEHPIRPPRRRRMRDQHARRAFMPHLRRHHVHHALGRAGVEVAGRLVGEDQAGPVYHGARDRDAL